MDEVNVAVIAPILGRDLSFVSEVDARVRVLDANFAAPGRWQVPNGQAEGEADRLGVVLAQAEVLLFGFPVLADLAARSPRLAWARFAAAVLSAAGPALALRRLRPDRPGCGAGCPGRGPRCRERWAWPARRAWSRQSACTSGRRRTPGITRAGSSPSTCRPCCSPLPSRSSAPRAASAPPVRPLRPDRRACLTHEDHGHGGVDRDAGDYAGAPYRTRARQRSASASPPPPGTSRSSSGSCSACCNRSRSSTGSSAVRGGAGTRSILC